MSYSLIEDQKVIELNTKLDSIIQKLNEKNQPQSEWLTIDEVMKVLHISKRTVFSYISSGQLSATHLAGRRKLFFLSKDVTDLLSKFYLKAFKN